MANPFLCGIVPDCRALLLALSDKLQEFGNLFFTADSLSQKLPSSSLPLASLQPASYVSLCSLGQAPPPGDFICLTPPHLVTFQSPPPRAPDHCHSLHQSFSLSSGRPAVSLHCVTLGRFLNLSGPVFSLVKCMFSLTELLFVCRVPH